jgi:transcription initiation factor TFIIIB Brf1 subunit/transcription initiation factor TFIIB
MKKGLFENESPYLIVATCIFTVSRITEPSKSLREISEVAHIKEADLKQGYEMVFDEIEDSLKGISLTLN